MSYYHGRRHTPMTKKEKVAYTTIGALLAPIGIGFTFLAAVAADYFWVQENERRMEYAGKQLSGEAPIYHLGDAALKDALKRASNPPSNSSKPMV